MVDGFGAFPSWSLLDLPTVLHLATSFKPLNGQTDEVRVADRVFPTFPAGYGVARHSESQAQLRLGQMEFVPAHA